MEDEEESGSHATVPPPPPPPEAAVDSDSDDPVSPASAAGAAGAASSSGYSSCFDADASSEIDRYCSANSALGSASLCSSLHASDFFFLGEGAEGRVSLSDDYKFPSPSESRRIFFGSDDEVANVSSSLSEHKDPVPRIRTGSLSRLLQAPQVLDELCSPSASGVKKIASLGSSSLDMASGRNSQSQMIEDAEDDASSSFEHSEGEDSMREYSADGVDRANLYQMRNLRQSEKLENVIENPLVITSSVAFGSDDWDDFLRETGEAGLSPLPLHQDHHPWLQVVNAKSEEKLSSMNSAINSSLDELEPKEGARDIAAASWQLKDIDNHAQNGKLYHSGIPLVDSELVHLDSGKCSIEGHMNSTYEIKGDIPSLYGKAIENVRLNKIAEKQMAGEQAPSRGSTGLQIGSISTEAFQGKELGNHDGDSISNFRPEVGIGHNPTFRTALSGRSRPKTLVEDDAILSKVNREDANKFYDEMVMEMEEILLDSDISHGSRANRGHVSQQSHHFRDGSSTASTSGTDDTYTHVQYSSKIDWVEVVGAKQKKGDVSFGERLVGVKEYTVYILRVWCGNDQWEVERRYRDFFSVYRQLRTVFNAHGLNLPSPWSYVDKESRKFFGNASPDVINERSVLIQDCLRSVLGNRYPFRAPNPLLSFLNPGRVAHDSNLFKALLPQSFQKLGDSSCPKVSDYGEGIQQDGSDLGKTISLVVDNKPRKSMQQLLELQHYRCAGCHEPFHAGNNLLGEFIQNLGWKKPRFCEYTSQLFCASCHTNDTAVLPAKVLHLWDFSLYPVSQLAKAYLESIYDQPMLCVSAVNPFLFSKVPALLHVMGVRKKIGAMFPYVQCPFRRSILRSLGSQRYLLESNDFFAIRDLVDLSKGAFAAFPMMVETISKRILDHITEQCLVCYDSGVPCAARQSCDDPSSLIFPFQEAEAARCGSCGSIFHNPCFAKLVGCPCGKQSSSKKNMAGQKNESDEVPNKPSSGSTSRQSTDILSKVRLENIWKPRKRNISPISLMISLPNTFL